MTEDILTEHADHDARALYVAGLREMARFIEAHPDLPLPYAGSNNAYVGDKQEMAKYARVSGVRWEKSAIGGYFFIRVPFSGGLSYDINVMREQICRKVVTGTRVEPATPERIVETFKWICDEPLLESRPA